MEQTVLCQIVQFSDRIKQEKSMGKKNQFIAWANGTFGDWIAMQKGLIMFSYKLKQYENNSKWFRHWCRYGSQKLLEEPTGCNCNGLGQQQHWRNLQMSRRVVSDSNKILKNFCCSRPILSKKWKEADQRLGKKCYLKLLCLIIIDYILKTLKLSKRQIIQLRWTDYLDVLFSRDDG